MRYHWNLDFLRTVLNTRTRIEEGSNFSNDKIEKKLRTWSVTIDERNDRSKWSETNFETLPCEGIFRKLLAWSKSLFSSSLGQRWLREFYKYTTREKLQRLISIFHETPMILPEPASLKVEHRFPWLFCGFLSYNIRQGMVNWSELRLTSNAKKYARIALEISIAFLFRLYRDHFISNRTKRRKSRESVLIFLFLRIV